MNYTIAAKRQRKLIFEGNSLSAFAVNSSFANGYYIPQAVYTNVKATHLPLVYTCLAISGRNQTQINTDIETNIRPIAAPGDIIVLWEGTNDMYTNGLSGAVAYANLVTYINTVKTYGARVVVCTVIARDYALDRADLMTDVDSYNNLVRSNASSLGITVCDLAADPLFDTRADASNGTYYNGDKIHQATAGQDQMITLMTTTLNLIF